MASNGEIVVSFDRMNRILDFNEADRIVRCQAGVVTETLQDYAAERGLFYPVDFASSGSSQIGGNISTNAGGIRVIRHGLTRDWVAGLKVVTGTGAVSPHPNQIRSGGAVLLRPSELAPGNGPWQTPRPSENDVPRNPTTSRWH